MLLFYLPHTRCYYDASVSFGLDAKEFDERLAAIEAKVASSSRSMSKSFSGISLGGVAGQLGAVLSVGAIAAAVKGLTDYGTKIQDLSNRFGVSTDAIQHFGNAAEKNGSSLEAVAMGFNKLEIARSKALQGDQELIADFQRLGISIVDLQKLNPETLMTKLGASSMNAAELVKILGKNALELRPTLAGIADGTIKMDDAIDAMDVKRLKEADDAWKSLFKTIEVLGGELLGTTIAAFKTVGDKAADVAKAIKQDWQSVIRILSDVSHGRFSEAWEAIKGAPTSGWVGAEGNIKGKAGVQVASTKKDGRDFGTEVDESAERRADSVKLTLSELASRDAYGSDNTYRGKYIGGDIMKAQAAEREKGLADDALFAGKDNEANAHMQRFQSLTQGIGSLKSTEKNPLTAKVDEIHKTAQEIAKNTAKPFENH